MKNKKRSNKLEINFAYAWFSNPLVHQGKIILEQDQGYKTDGFEIDICHRKVFVRSYNLDKKNTMKASVKIWPNFFQRIKNLLTGYAWQCPTIQHVEKQTEFLISQISSINFDDGYDDSCFSFTKEE